MILSSLLFRIVINELMDKKSEINFGSSLHLSNSMYYAMQMKLPT